MNKLRVAAGLVLILGLVGWTARDVWQTVVTLRKQLGGVKLEVVAFEERCAAVRDQLPARGRVGYRDLSREAFPDGRHALVQYALVPLIVEWKTDRTPAVVVLPGAVRVYQGGP